MGALVRWQTLVIEYLFVGAYTFKEQLQEVACQRYRSV